MKSFDGRLLHCMIPLACATAFAILVHFFLRECRTRLVQVWGFLSASAVFFLMGMVSLTNAPQTLFYLLYISLFCILWAPTVTTYVVCVESYTPEVRCTLTGLSVAFGKLGAIFGFQYFDFILREYRLAYCFIMGSG